MKSKKILLVGMMGVGKTTVGKRLARVSGFTHIDTDAEIERDAGKSVLEIFEEDGEPSFRQAEADLCDQIISDSRDLVVSTGGGFLNSVSDIDLVLKNCLCVYIKANSAFIASRVYTTDSNRPLVRLSKTKQEFEAAIENQLRQRELRYELAPIHVDALGLDVEDLWRQIEPILK